MSQNKQETGRYYRHIEKYLTELVENKKSELKKYGRFWNFRMRFVIRREIKKFEKQIEYYQGLIEEYKKHGWIT